MDGNEDAELTRLLKAAIGGDEAAYAAFLRRVAALVRRFAQKRITHGGLDAEDIVQETLLAIHLKRHTWRIDAPVGPWLFAIARYKLIDAFRKSGRSMEVTLGDDFDAAAPEAEETVSERDIVTCCCHLPDSAALPATMIGPPPKCASTADENSPERSGAAPVRRYTLTPS